MVIAIVGAGASGMAAALAASENAENSVVVFERQSRVGKKLSATGNGRCNLSNRNVSPEHYHGEDPAFAAPALQRFSVEDTLAWFASLGLLVGEPEEGKLYPFSEQASSVADVLRLALEARGVELKVSEEVRGIKDEGNSFILRLENGDFRADRVILAAGGLAGSKLGGSLSGYKLLQSLGHSCTKLYPSLVQLCTDPSLVRPLKGIRTGCTVRVLRGKEEIASTLGEVQFTDYGLSGPAIFEISRYVTESPEGCRILLNLLPGVPSEGVIKLLKSRVSAFPERPLENFLTGLLQNRLGRTLLLRLGFSLSERAEDLSERELCSLADILSACPFDISGTMGMEQAQITAGGIRTGEFDADTMESRLHPGLFACGELLDLDGDCGGYNLQWAWSSGRLAGESAGRKL